MPRFIDYDPPKSVLKEVEVLSPEGETYTLRVRRTKQRIVVESITDPHGRITSAADLIRDCRTTVEEVRALMAKAFKD